MESGQNRSLQPAVESTEINQAAELLPAAASINANSSHHDHKIVNFSRDGAKAGTKYPQSQPPSSLDQGVATDFKALPDGSLLEPVTTRETPLELQLLHWSSSRFDIADRVHFGGKVFAPPQWSPSLLRAVRMPTAVMPSGPPRLIFNRISEVLRTFVDLPDEMLVRVVAYVLATWFPESLTVAPLLWITGPSTSGKTTLLRLLHCLCRRAILVTDVTPAALYSLPALLKPTLLIDECELGNTGADQHVIRLIRAGSTRGVYVARRDEVFDPFCLKAVASRTWPDDGAVASRAVFIAMLPTRRILPAFDPQLIADEVDALQAQLLDFRLRNFHLVRVPQLRAASELNPRTLQIARSLATPFLGDKLLEGKLIPSLCQQDQEADAVRHEQPECVVVEALFKLAHEKPVGELFVQGIALRANNILIERGDGRSFTAKRVGIILRSLGIKTERLGSWGRGICINPHHQRQVHRLAHAFGITRRDTTGWMALKGGYGGLPCPLCGEFDLNAGLRFIPRPPLKPRHRLIDRSDPPGDLDRGSLSL
jgi:hypothetical protein